MGKGFVQRIKFDLKLSTLCKSRIKTIISTVLFLLLLFVQAKTSFADLEWDLSEEIILKVDAIDISSSSDGKWIFVLVPGGINVYSMLNKEILTRIPVDKDSNKISYIEKNKSLVVSNNKNKLQLIKLEEIFEIDTKSLPYKGAKDAPVTISVFSDYQ